MFSVLIESLEGIIHIYAFVKGESDKLHLKDFISKFNILILENDAKNRVQFADITGRYWPIADVSEKVYVFSDMRQY